MVLEAIPKTAGGRPPTFGGPPIGTTFSNEPDDRDDMIVHMRDNIQRIVQQAQHADRRSAPQYLKLLDQRKSWIKGELDVEGLLSEPSKAPLGISENVYDLATLSIEPIDERRKQYERMIELLERAMGDLWNRMLSSDDPTE